MFEKFVQSALRRKTDISIDFAKLSELIDELRDAQKAAYPNAEMGEIGRQLEDAFVFNCPNCGQLKSSAVLMGAMVKSMQGMNPEMATIFGGPNISNLAGGRCPGCGGAILNVSYDPLRIQAITPLPDDGNVTGQQVPAGTSASAGPPPSQTRTEPAVEWYYAVEGKSFGPYTEAQLISCARAGYFKRDDHVYTAKLGQWVRADTVSGLFTDATAGAGAFVQAGAGGTPVYAAPGAWAAMQPMQCQYAGFWIRFLAVFIDGLVLFIPQCLIAMIFAGGIGIWAGFQATGFPAGPPDPARLLSLIGMYMLMVAGGTAIQWLYFALLESSSW